MERFSAINVGRLDSVGGVGQSTGAKAPSLASFLSQRANQVLGSRQGAEAVQSQVVENEAAPVATHESNTVNPQLARQMEQLQRLHTSIAPTSYHGISVLV